MFPLYILAATVILVCYAALRKYIAGPVYENERRLHGKTVIITGSNTGIGKETARNLAKRGARVILACRDLKKAEAAKEEIATETGCHNNLVVRRLDLASLASVRLFAKTILESEKRLDILINNAGLAFTYGLQLTEDGFEMQFGVNHLGHFLLTNLLLDLLKTSAPSRVVNVSSAAHAFGLINFDDLNDAKDRLLGCYSQSKLANILFTKELARRLEGTGVDVYSLHPGTIYTDMFLRMPAMNLPIIRSIIPYFVKTPKEGAQTTLYCALAEELEGVSGKYYSDCHVKEPAKNAQDTHAATKLWNVSAELVGSETIF